mgnify:CR=1 FL=1
MRISKQLLITIYVILTIAFLLRLGASRMPVLGTWDERFHALVAKNLIDHPLEPTLYDQPVLAHDHEVWSQTHIYLEKPPLPMWLMAVSIYLLGLTEFAVRLPSILLATLSVWLTFLIGKRLFDRRVGMYAAFFHAIHGMTLELVGGRISNDHVDVIFLFFFEWGLWAVLEYFHQQKPLKYSTLTIGLLTGLAFMCKWISAGFIPIIWFVLAIGFGRQKRLSFFLKEMLIIALGFFVVATPWLVYILEIYPEESRHTLLRVFMRVNSSIELHQHPWYFFLDHARMIFGELIYLPMLWLLYKFLSKPGRKSTLTLVALIFVPLLLISLMDTKRSPYLLLCAPGFFLLTGFFLHYFIKLSPRLRVPYPIKTLFLILIIGLPIRYSIERLKPFHPFSKEQAIKASVDSTKLQLPVGESIVLFNEPYPIRTMFYCGITAYQQLPEPATLKKLVQEGYQVLIKEENKVIPFEH